MLAEAEKLNPGIPFLQGNMLTLPIAANQLAGIAAFYSIIHLERGQVPDALAEMFRVLRPDGYVLLAFHLGLDVLHTTELWGYKVDLKATFFSTEEVTDCLRQTGFQIETAMERDPYPADVEYQSRRSYILARKFG